MANDSPFFLNKCRPEWFLQWMREHPDCQLTKDHAPNADPIRGDNSGKCLGVFTPAKRAKRLKSNSI